jgi:predicted SAM-dependent methyltransferase
MRQFSARQIYFGDWLRPFERAFSSFKPTSLKQRLGRALKRNAITYWLIELGVRVAFFLKRRRQLETYLATQECPKLNLGSGVRPISGWINADLTPWRKSIVYMDATKPLPLPSASMTFVYSEHMIEHIDYEQARVCLQEAFRVLRPGGYVRIATPDLDRMLTLKTDTPNDVQRAYVAWANRQQHGDNPAFAINRMFREYGHQFIYDYRTLRDLLVACGFDRVQRRCVGESEHPELVGLEMHGLEIGEAFNLLETMVVEAHKP